MLIPLKTGDRVMIYHDPITKLKLEGPAVLIGPIGQQLVVDLQYWRVHFTNDPKRWVERWIYMGPAESPEEAKIREMAGKGRIENNPKPEDAPGSKVST